jgi:uncharacterized membrane protein
VADHTAFGEDAFGRRAEKLARFFGTPQYILSQTIIVILWIALNSVGWVYHWDPRPWIMLNLVFSTQAAYAAPLILLAQTRQADRDKAHGDMIDKRHTGLEQALQSETEKLVTLLQSNTEITQQDKQRTEEVAKLTREIHTLLKQRGTAD